jgi:ABC-type nitrate/sulfonate/bicarbonate transport system substrate-binding protein
MNNRILLLTALLCASLPGAARADEPIILRYGQNAAGAGGLSSLPLTLAQQKNFLVREGINLVVVPIAGGTDRIVAALDQGEIDAGKNATPYLIQAVLKGSDAVAIMGQTANPIYSLIARPDIKSFADLRGKTLGLSTPGDTITLSTLRLIARAHLKMTDFTGKVVVGTAARFNCLKSGECAAVPMGQPEDLDAIRQGFPRLAFTYEAGADLLFNVDMTRRAWGARHKDTLTRFARAMGSAYAFMNDPRNRDEMTAIVAETGNVSTAVAAEIFAPYLEPDRNVLPRKGEVDLAALNRVIDLMAEVGAIPSPAPGAERFVDLQYVKAAGIE